MGRPHGLLHGSRDSLYIKGGPTPDFGSDPHKTSFRSGRGRAGVQYTRNICGRSRPTVQIKRRLLIYRAKYKNKFFGKNRCNRCNRVTRAIKALLYIGILSYISEKQKCNRAGVYVTRKGKIAYKGAK